MHEHALDIDGVEFEYHGLGGTNRVLRGVSLHVDRGELVALMGPSGCGKSTLLAVAGGLRVPDVGTVHVAGEEISAYDDSKRARVRRFDTGYIFQSFNLVPFLTLTENVMLPLMVDGRDTREKRRQASQLIDSAGLTARAHALAEELSGGEQQRTAILRCVLAEPAVILADEPTGNLDTKRAEHVFEMVRSAARERDAGVLMATHDPVLAARCDRVIAMADGVITGTRTFGTMDRDDRITVLYKLGMSPQN